ncbi:MAG: hypothetical protein JO044_12690 [Mycobacteriaceae bacterium]|nr:hypothetical protein [Mycobacteriaceae bacterium]
MARVLVLFAVGLLAVTMTACGGSTTPTGHSPPTSTLSTTVATEPVTKVSANTASQAEIQAALSNVGVSDAGRWAAEVVQNRPYPADDANLTKLRNDLARDNPGRETVDKIVSALTP